MSKPTKVGKKWRIRWIDAHGVRQSEYFHEKETAKSAIARRLIDTEDIKAGRKREGSELTLREASVTWLASRAPAPGSAPDVARRRGKQLAVNTGHMEQHILPVLGDYRLPEITPQMVTVFLKNLEGKPIRKFNSKNLSNHTLKSTTIATIAITLRKMLNDLGFPIRIKYKTSEYAYNWIKNAEDVGRFLGEIKLPWFKMACELACYAGLRKGEVAGLTWNKIDFDRNLMVIDRSYDGPCKSKHVRMVPLAPELATSLKRWRLATGAASGGSLGFVVITSGGRRGKSYPISPDDQGFSIMTKRACKRAGVDPVTFHELRHTCASHLAGKVSLPEIGAILGHADPKTTARYAHLDTASLARDPRLHLTFTAPSGKVAKLGGPNLAQDESATPDTAEKLK